MKTEQVIPHGYVRVTEVLSRYTKLSEIDPATVAAAADRGSRVHSFCEMYMLNLFVTDVDEDCKNYFNAFKKWFDDTVTTVLYVEKRINNDNLRISGQIDLIAMLKGDSEPTLIDIKTPQTESSTWQLQTAAYHMLARKELDFKSLRRICVMLPKSNPYARVIEYENHVRDSDLFLKALDLHRFFS